MHGTDLRREASIWRWRIGVPVACVAAIAAIVAGKGMLLLIGLPGRRRQSRLSPQRPVLRSSISGE
jgi:hypothetical protein